MSKDIRVEVEVNRERANWGHGNLLQGLSMRYFAAVLVEADGTVRKLDNASCTYSLHHDLTEAEEATARSLAAAKQGS